MWELNSLEKFKKSFWNFWKNILKTVLLKPSPKISVWHKKSWYIMKEAIGKIERKKTAFHRNYSLKSEDK